MADRVALVITFDNPENDLEISSRLDTIRMQMNPALQGLGNGRLWVGIRESAEAIMKVTGENNA